MRDPNRLPAIYDKVMSAHKLTPDQRFLQFISNFCGWYYSKYKRDIFFVEDDQLEKLVDEYIAQWKFKE